MFNKKKFKLVENKSKMFNLSMSNVKWRNYVVTIGLAVFGLILIFGNYKSSSYYAKLKAAKKEMLQNSSQPQSIQVFRNSDKISIKCDTSRCSVTCSGDMNDLKNYLESQKSCSSIKLRIAEGIFPEEKLQSNWIEGSFNLSSIIISLSDLNKIENGAFNHQTVAFLSELELNSVQIMNLTEHSFIGLKAIETFTLVNRIEFFSGNAFLKPMMKTLKKIVLKHVTSIATDPDPWLIGESFPKLETILFDGSNFGGYITAATFQHLKQLKILKMNYCKISDIAVGSFDFMMSHMVVLITLRNNQLKRLDGDFLSKVSPLKRIDIENNPWDCTCELEHLARVFKEYPEGFGNKLNCSTPPDKAGKLLNEIELKRCEDEPKTPLPTSDSTSTITFTTSTTSASSKDLLTSTAIEEPSTTPSPQNRTTTLAADSIFIECSRHKIRFTRYPSNFLELSPPDGHFTIVSISETSARLIFQGPTDDFAVIWFYEQPNLDENGGNVRIVGEFSVGCQSELDTSLVVEGLVLNQSYIFCLVKNGNKIISPFNCQSHFTSVDGVNTNDMIWLRKKDRPLVIGVFVASILVSLCLGLIGMFLLVLYQPCLLKGSKRIIVVNRNSRKDVAVPRRNIQNSVTEQSFANSYNSEATTAELRRFSCDSGLSYMMANNYEELEYRWRMNGNNDLIFSNRIPKSPAPPLPKRISFIAKKSPQSSDIAHNIDGAGYRGNDYGYTSVS